MRTDEHIGKRSLGVDQSEEKSICHINSPMAQGLGGVVFETVQKRVVLTKAVYISKKVDLQAKLTDQSEPLGLTGALKSYIITSS